MSSLFMPVMAIARHRMATDGVGVTTLVVSQGCPLQCKWCINPYTWSGDRKAKRYTPQELLDTLKIDDLYFRATGGGITFGGCAATTRLGIAATNTEIAKTILVVLICFVSY